MLFITRFGSASQLAEIHLGQSASYVSDYKFQVTSRKAFIHFGKILSSPGLKLSKGQTKVHITQFNRISKI